VIYHSVICCEQPLIMLALIYFFCLFNVTECGFFVPVAPESLILIGNSYISVPFLIAVD